MRVENFRDKLDVLPEVPGCYLYRNEVEDVIYVGKSKNLKKRVNSYFKGAHDVKTTLLVSEIFDFEFVVTSSELEALVLELNLIKQYSPKYNIKLNDDSSYPYIQVTYERHPKIIVTRDPKKKNGKVFGPFPSAYAAQETVKLLNRLYPLRKCVRLPKKECLYFHLGQCLAPCIKNVDNSQYITMRDSIYKFLNGDIKDQVKEMTLKMHKASEDLEFEKAIEYRELIANIKRTVEKQQITISDFKDRDIFGYFTKDNLMSISIFYLRNGKIVARDIDTVEMYDSPVYSFLNYVAQYYTNFNKPKPKEILLQVTDNLLSDLLGVKCFVPQRGEKKKIVDMAINNAEKMMEQQVLLFQRKKDRTIVASAELAELLNLSKIDKIEAFDNSNLMGTDSVSGMVTFIDGEPNKKLYRKYKVKTVIGPDDYGTMKEVIYRRYLRVIMDKLEKPDLIIVDGGKGQVKVAKEILDTLGLSIPIIGLKKDSKHVTDSIINSKLEEIKISKRSNVYKLLNRIQEEVHRYAISFHRTLRNKSTFASILDDIDGLGPKRRQLLFKKFASIKEIKEASIQDLINIGISKSLAENILNTLKGK